MLLIPVYILSFQDFTSLFIHQASLRHLNEVLCCNLGQKAKVIQGEQDLPFFRLNKAQLAHKLQIFLDRVTDLIQVAIDFF